MSISAQDVKTLRERTGAGMMDCKKALTDANGDFDVAIDVLKKQGLAKAVKKGGRIAAEGLIFSRTSGTEGIVLELNCETDFVARNEDYTKLGESLVDLILEQKPATLEETLSLSLNDGTVESIINEHISKIGEKISLRRFQTMQVKQGGQVGLYSHAGGKIAVLIEVTGNNVTEETIKDLAMQITAMSPQYIDKSEVPEDILNKEKAIHLEQLRESGKPENILEKIVAGKLDKFAGEMSLLQQAYVKDSSGKQKVADYLKSVDPEAKIIQFIRYNVGEVIEKRKDDFAEEVARMTQ
ncbi:translation elongation factor Ts [bacterium]|nr:translation elongation factor Ts [bacterium]